jgi:uncharacterized protein
LPKLNIVKESNNISSRERTLVFIAISAVFLMTVAKIWQAWGEVTILPVVWKVSDIGLSVAVAVVSVGLSSILYRFWTSYSQSVDNYVEPILEPLGWWDLIWLGILPGLSEELLFRGVMLSAFGLDLTAVIFSSLVFGLLHLRDKQYWPYALLVTLMSFILGYSALATQNLLVPILIHILNNVLSSAVWKYSKILST